MQHWAAFAPVAVRLRAPFVFAVVWGVFGCSGGSAALSPLAGATRPLSAVADTAGPPRTLIFAGSSSQGQINIYSSFGRQVGHISGLGSGAGLAADANGTLYVPATNSGTIYVLPKPYSGRPRQLKDAGQFPASVAVDMTTGLVAVANILSQSGGPGSVSFFEKGAKMPCATVTGANFSRIYFDAFDASGNLFVDGTGADGSLRIGEVSGRCKAHSIAPLTTPNSMQFPGGVGVNTANQICVEDQATGTVYTYAQPHNGSLKLIGTTSLGAASDVTNFAFTADGKHLWAADVGRTAANEFAYPAGGAPELTIRGVDSGIAVTPVEVP